MIRPSARSFALLGVVVLSFLAVKPRADAQTSSLAGSYELVARHSGKCLDITGVSVDDSALAIQWDCHGGPNQQWTFQATGDGYYVLIARHSGKALDVLGESLVNGAPVGQYTIDGRANQQWSVQPIGGGYYTLTARHSGKALDVTGVSTASGAAVIQWPLNGGDNQAWLIRGLGSEPQGPSAADMVRFLEQATLGPTPELVDHVQEVGFEEYLEEQFDGADVELSDAAALPDHTRQRHVSEQLHVPAGQLHDCIRCRTGSSSTRLYGAGSAAAAGRLRAAPDHRRVRRRHHPAELDDARTCRCSIATRSATIAQLLYEITLNPAMGNYLDVDRQHQDSAERELRPRGAAAVLDRHGHAESRRHAAARRRRPAGADLQPDDRQQFRARLHRLAAGRRARPASRTTSTRWSPTKRSTTSPQRRC